MSQGSIKEIKKFYKREEELKLLKDVFEKDVLHQSEMKVFLISGVRGIGKSRLISEFKKYVKEEGNKIKFCEIAEYDSDLNKDNYTNNFEGIASIKNHLKKKSLSDINTDDVLKYVDELELLLDFPGGKILSKIITFTLEKIFRKKEINLEAKLFEKYKNFLIKNSSKHPHLLIFNNAQLMDLESLIIIESLYYSKRFNGIILLEREENYLHSDENIIKKIEKNEQKFYEFKKNKLLDVIQLKNFENITFPNEFLECEFGENFFESQENDLLYAVSNGIPGNLIKEINARIDQQILRFNNNKWQKEPDFIEQIKPNIINLIENIQTYYRDGELNKSELDFIKKQAGKQKISDDKVNFLINMVKDIYDLELTIISILPGGILTTNTFTAYDKQNKRYLIEYAQITEVHPQCLIQNKNEYGSKLLLEAQQIKIGENGIVFVWDYFSGFEVRLPFVQARNLLINNTIKDAIEILRAIEYKHNHSNHAIGLFTFKENKIYLPPDVSYLPSNEIKNLDYYSKYILYKHPLKMEQIIYLAPEIIEKRIQLAENDNIDLSQLDIPGPKADIYSIGVHIYKSITGKSPFNAKDDKELLKLIKLGDVDFDGTLVESVPDILQKIIIKCLSYKPDDRYNNVSELIAELRDIRIENDDVSVVVSPSMKPNKTRKKYYKYALVPSLLIMIYFTYFLIFNNSRKIIDNAVVIIDRSKIESASENKLLPQHLLYLFEDEIKQSSNSLKVFLRNGFLKKYTDSKVPQIEIIFTLNKESDKYLIGVTVKDNGKETLDKTTEFRNEADIFKIIKESIASISSIKWKESKFTENWDAFVEFYHGEIEWKKLNKVKAENFFKAAFTRDDNFVLAHLRYAEVLRFDGEIDKAKEQLDLISTKLHLLSKTDSLKAEAMKYRVIQKTFKAIPLYRIIADITDRAEDYYELGENYYQARDILNAKQAYDEAIKRDSLFARAWNHIGYCYMHMGQHKQAIKAMRVYVELDSSANAYDSQGDCYLAAGILDSAEIAKKNGIRLSTETDYLYSSLVHIFLRGGNIDSARKYINLYERTAKSEIKRQNLAFYKAYLDFSIGNITSAYKICQNAINKWIVEGPSRENKLYWLLGLISFEQDNISRLIDMYSNLDDLIRDNEINNTNYHEIYKLYRHLELLFSIKENDFNKFEEIVKEFDDSKRIKYKIKDGSQPFGQDYFFNLFGEYYRDYWKDNNKAEKYFVKSLEYNPNYALAHYNLRKLYRSQNDKIKTPLHQQKLTEIWGNADANIKNIYGVE
jgi:serine/threonine protein kinase